MMATTPVTYGMHIMSPDTRLVTAHPLTRGLGGSGVPGPTGVPIGAKSPGLIPSGGGGSCDIDLCSFDEPGMRGTGCRCRNTVPQRKPHPHLRLRRAVHAMRARTAMI